MQRLLLTLTVAGVAFFAGVFFAFLSTPLLWKLEGPLHMELAGHSGPADWILVCSGLIVASIAGGVTYKSLSKK